MPIELRRPNAEHPAYGRTCSAEEKKKQAVRVKGKHAESLAENRRPDASVPVRGLALLKQSIEAYGASLHPGGRPSLAGQEVLQTTPSATVSARKTTQSAEGIASRSTEILLKTAGSALESGANAELQSPALRPDFPELRTVLSRQATYKNSALDVRLPVGPAFEIMDDNRLSMNEPLGSQGSRCAGARHKSKAARSVAATKVPEGRHDTQQPVMQSRDLGYPLRRPRARALNSIDFAREEHPCPAERDDSIHYAQSKEAPKNRATYWYSENCAYRNTSFGHLLPQLFLKQRGGVNCIFPGVYDAANREFTFW